MSIDIVASKLLKTLWKKKQLYTLLDVNHMQQYNDQKFRSWIHSKFCNRIYAELSRKDFWRIRKKRRKVWEQEQSVSWNIKDIELMTSMKEVTVNTTKKLGKWDVIQLRMMFTRKNSEVRKMGTKWTYVNVRWSSSK